MRNILSYQEPSIDALYTNTWKTIPFHFCSYIKPFFDSFNAGLYLLHHIIVGMQQEKLLAVVFFMFWAASEVVMDCKPAAKS